MEGTPKPETHKTVSGKAEPTTYQVMAYIIMEKATSASSIEMG